MLANCFFLFKKRFSKPLNTLWGAGERGGARARCKMYTKHEKLLSFQAVAHQIFFSILMNFDFWYALLLLQGWADVICAIFYDL